jgi:hypothetical protein
MVSEASYLRTSDISGGEGFSGEGFSGEGFSGEIFSGEGFSNSPAPPQL